MNFEGEVDKYIEEANILKKHQKITKNLYHKIQIFIYWYVYNAITPTKLVVSLVVPLQPRNLQYQ